MKKAAIVFFIAALWSGSVAVAVVFGERRAAKQTVLWYNDEWFRVHNNAPGGMTFNIGTKNYEFGVRADGVVIVREYNDANRPASQVNAKPRSIP